jgi:hypothetical protein
MGLNRLANLAMTCELLFVPKGTLMFGAFPDNVPPALASPESWVLWPAAVFAVFALAAADFAPWVVVVIETGPDVPLSLLLLLLHAEKNIESVRTTAAVSIVVVIFFILASLFRIVLYRITT